MYDMCMGVIATGGTLLLTLVEYACPVAAQSFL